jgi:hypothetical protein
MPLACPNLGLMVPRAFSHALIMARLAYMHAFGMAADTPATSDMQQYQANSAWVCARCTYAGNRPARRSCSMCGAGLPLEQVQHGQVQRPHMARSDVVVYLQMLPLPSLMMVWPVYALAIACGRLL